MRHSFLKLLLASGFMFSGASFAQTVDDLLTCEGWIERASQPYGKYFLEMGPFKDAEDTKAFKQQYQIFNKAFKVKPNPKANDWDNDTTFIPRDKNSTIFESITYYGFNGAGFQYRGKLKPNVNIDELKAKLEKRDNVKFINYSPADIKQIQAGYKQIEKLMNEGKDIEQNHQKLAKQFPWENQIMVKNDNLKQLSIAGKMIKDGKEDTDFATFIAIEKAGKVPANYLVCGVSEKQR